MDGSATLTTLLSRIAMLDPRIVAIKVRRFLDAERLRGALDDETATAVCTLGSLMRSRSFLADSNEPTPRSTACSTPP
jgi:hypothetical protein